MIRQKSFIEASPRPLDLAKPVFEHIRSGIPNLEQRIEEVMQSKGADDETQIKSHRIAPIVVSVKSLP